MKQRIKNLIIVAPLLIPAISHAAQLKNPLRFSGITAIVTFVVNVLVSVVGFVAIIAIILAGYQMIFSAGEAEKLKAAKNRLVWAIIGLLVVVLAYSIIRILLTVLT